MMPHSYNFLLHIIAFGFSSAIIISMFILHRKIVSEQDWGRRFYVGGIMRAFATIGPYLVAVLLLTGFGNMVNRYGVGVPWPQETWLMVKIILFVILSFNNLYIGPRISIRRAALIKSVVDKKGPENADELWKKHNKAILIFLYVQAAILLCIVILSAFGSGKHPGMF